MPPALTLLLTTAVAAALALFLWRRRDHHADRVEAARLIATQPTEPARFDPSLIADLPEPARRFLTFAIAPGTPLRTVARISMRGRFSMGSAQAPNYMALAAEQVLAAPTGFVWKARAAKGAMHLSGSDAGGWTRFWLMGLLPVARLGGNPDHARSAFGRHVAEAAFWSPAALLPGESVSWSPVDARTARVTFRHGGLEQAVDVRINEDGSPAEVRFQRWSNANRDKTWRLQPFGGYLSDFREFEGFRVPTHVEAGNGFGTPDYFAFFVVDVTSVHFPPPAAAGDALRHFGRR